MVHTHSRPSKVFLQLETPTKLYRPNGSEQIPGPPAWTFTKVKPFLCSVAPLLSPYVLSDPDVQK